MNINSVRTLVLIVNVGLAGGTGWTVYNEFRQKDTRRDATTAFGDQLKADLERQPKPKVRDITHVTIKEGDLVDLTGDKPRAPEPPRPESVASSRTYMPLEDQIRIVTISMHPDRSASHVTLVRKQGTEVGTERVNFSEGEVIPFANEAVVLEIWPSKVIFQNGDRTETLQIPDKPSTPAGGSTSQSRPGDKGDRPFLTYLESKRDSSTVTIKSGGDKALAREGEAVLDGAVFSTTEGAGGKKMLRIDKVPPALGQHGVQDGDTLISIDGTAMSTKSEVVDYVKQHQNKPSYEVVFLRRGNRVTKIVVVER
jgi:type II secretory pathway component PulC